MLFKEGFFWEQGEFYFLSKFTTILFRGSVKIPHVLSNFISQLINSAPVGIIKFHFGKND